MPEVWVPEGELLAGPLAALLKLDTLSVPSGDPHARYRSPSRPAGIPPTCLRPPLRMSPRPRSPPAPKKGNYIIDNYNNNHHNDNNNNKLVLVLVLGALAQSLQTSRAAELPRKTDNTIINNIII